MNSVVESRSGVYESLVSDATESGRSERAGNETDAESGFGLIGLALVAVSTWALYEALHLIASRITVPSRADLLHFLGVPPGAFFF